MDIWRQQAELEMLPPEQRVLVAEIVRLRQALAGHLFDGESLTFREALRSELVQQGIRLDGALADPSDELLAVVATAVANEFGFLQDAVESSGFLPSAARAALIAACEFCWSQDAVGHSESDGGV